MPTTGEATPKSPATAPARLPNKVIATNSLYTVPLTPLTCLHVEIQGHSIQEGQ